MDPIVKKLSSAWATHPIIGPMYGPAYWLGRTIIQKAIEDRGIPSVTISQYPRLSRLYHVSRIVYPVGFLPGHIVGPPNFAELQREVLRDALELLTTATNPLSILEKEYPQYPVQPIKKRFQFWDQPRYRKNKAAS